MTVATQTDQNNVVIYLIIGSIAVAIVGALLFLNSRRSANQTEPSTKTRSANYAPTYSATTVNGTCSPAAVD